MPLISALFTYEKVSPVKTNVRVIAKSSITPIILVASFSLEFGPQIKFLIITVATENAARKPRGDDSKLQRIDLSTKLQPQENK